MCSTLSGAGSQPLLELVLRIPGFNFDAVIIDEAAQAIEPSALIPFKYNPASVVLVGDPCQLPATVFSTLAKKARLGKSLFQRLQQAGYPVLMLETQYRMHPAIVNYPSRRFYRGNLRTGANVRNTDSHHMPYHADPTGRFRPFLFHHCSEGIETRDGVSICNRDEAKYVIDLFEELVRKYPDHRRNVGIIAPYRAQRRNLFRLFEERFRSGAVQHRQDSGGGWITVNDLDTEIATVDGFQGREKDIVIFSCVRAPATVRALKKVNSSAAARENRQQAYGMNSAGATATAAVGNNSSGGVDAEEEDITEAIGEELNDEADLEDDIAGIGFLREWQRLNVAITRAKYALWIVGNATFLQRDKEWMELIKHARKRGCFINTNQDNVSAPAQTYRRSDASKSGRGGSGSQHSDKNRSRKRRKSAATIPVNNNNRSCYAPQYSSYAERKASKKSRKNERKRQRREEQRREQSKN